MPSCENLDHDHLAAAAGAWRCRIDRLVERRLLGIRHDSEQLAGKREADLPGGAGEQALVADPVKAARQNMEQESADELVGAERHDALAVGAIAAVILVAHGHAGIAEC